jgi:hypothetical protein
MKETSYNPITQKYQDNRLESHAKRMEQENFIDVIATNKVRHIDMSETNDYVGPCFEV